MPDLGCEMGGLSSRNGNRDGNGAHALAGDDAEGFSVYGAAASEDLVEHTRQCDFLVTLSTQLEMEMDGVYLGKRCRCLMCSTYRPGSYSVDAIGESSQWTVIKPSNGRCGSGRTIFASTCASTLHKYREIYMICVV